MITIGLLVARRGQGCVPLTLPSPRMGERELSVDSLAQPATGKRVARSQGVWRTRSPWEGLPVGGGSHREGSPPSAGLSHAPGRAAENALPRLLPRDLRVEGLSDPGRALPGHARDGTVGDGDGRLRAALVRSAATSLRRDRLFLGAEGAQAVCPGRAPRAGSVVRQEKGGLRVGLRVELRAARVVQVPAVDVK